MTLFVGSVFDILPTLPAGSVRCVVTSPPYWGLRDYGTATWEGGSVECDHRKAPDAERAIAGSTLGGGKKTTGHQQEGFGRECGKCGARRIDSQIGLEATPEEYVARMVAVFREVKRVLTDDGTLWLNLGDSYASGAGGDHGFNSTVYRRKGSADQRRSPITGGLKPKDLCGIPWRVAFALQGDGWYLRSDIIWAKPNPMPESVTDRPTKSHEYIFLLSKSQKYYFDADAVKEGVAHPFMLHKSSRKSSEAESAYFGNAPSNLGRCGTDPSGRNIRTVWTIATQPYAEAHFATFPEAIPARCISAGSAIGDTVLDPFMGSGTVAAVAERLGRKWIGCELNPKYAEMIHKRTAQRGLLGDAA